MRVSGPLLPCLCATSTSFGTPVMTSPGWTGARYSYSCSPCNSLSGLIPRALQRPGKSKPPQVSKTVGRVGGAMTSAYPAACAAAASVYTGLVSPIARTNSLILPRSTV